MLKVRDGYKETEIKIEEETNLLKVLRENNIYVDAPCGGKGKCKKCTVGIEGKKVLACKTTVSPNEDITVDVGSFKFGKIAPEIFRVEEDNALNKVGAEYGFAIDLGTTTVTVALVNKTTENIIDTESFINPQRAYGADVLSRITASLEGRGEELSDCIRNAVDQAKNLLVERNGLVDRNSLVDRKEGKSFETVMAGNTVMCQLFRKLDLKGFAAAPFNVDNLEIYHEDNLTVFPCVGAFLGGDIVAGIYALDLDLAEENNLFIDLGTNGEIVFGNSEGFLGTSTSAGPVFEGGGIKNGMPATDGAICHTKIFNGRVLNEIVGNKKATGICGSGIIDIVSELFRNNIIDETGILSDKYFEAGFPLAENVEFTQNDIREIQMGKAAIRSGIEKLLVDAADYSKLYLAGGFGYSVNTDSAINIGLLPEGCRGKIQSSGNTSLMGAVKLLCRGNSEEKRLEEICEKIRIINLAGTEDFSSNFLEYMNFKKTN